ncbi:MAG: endonuclease/exonuclease/phosphatase family protein [Planctomycetes bacterium]|nr:endonuclease/exonuclease/phosphatase family protein [Planctomycetota bacterium]
MPSPGELTAPRPGSADDRPDSLGVSDRLRVATYNAHQSPRLDYTCRFLASMNADLYCLQELVVDDFHHQPRDQTSVLAAWLGLHYFSAYTCLGFRRNAGSAILSRYPLGEVEILADGRGHRFGLATIIDHSGGQLALICAHFTWVPRPACIGSLVSIPFRTAEIRMALGWLKRTGLPGIIAGDFNAVAHSPEYWTIARRMTDCTRAVPMPDRATRPTWGLPTQLDYIFVTDDFETIACRMPYCQVSDHRPLVADLRFATGRWMKGRDRSHRWISQVGRSKFHRFGRHSQRRPIVRRPGP